MSAHDEDIAFLLLRDARRKWEEERKKNSRRRQRA